MKFGVLFSLLLLMGCTHPMQRMMGHTKETLYATYGPPTLVEKNTQGGGIWIYTSYTQNYSPGYTANPMPNIPTSSYGNAAAYGAVRGIIQGMNQPSVNTTTRHQMFWLNNAGRVVGWRDIKR